MLPARDARRGLAGNHGPPRLRHPLGTWTSRTSVPIRSSPSAPGFRRDGGLAAPDAMAVATSTPDGRPSARVVLLRGIDERGLVFFTNLGSRKGEELAENPHAAAVLHWWELGRQVRIEGVVEQVERDESAAYWATRPRASRVAAWASPQSARSPAARSSRRSSRTPTRASRTRRCPSRLLGSAQDRARVLGVLDAPRRPAARPHPLRARGQRMAARATRTVKRGGTHGSPARLLLPSIS